MSGWQALVYADACRIRNMALNIVRKPIRLLPWLIFALWFGLSLFTSSWRARPGRTPHPLDIHEPFLTLIGGIVLVILALSVIVTASSGRLVGARDPADAYFLARSTIPEPVVFLWLQTRTLAINLFRAIIMLFVFVFSFAGRNATAPMLAYIGIGLLWNASCIPAFFLARRYKVAAIGVGVAIALIGAALVAAAGLDMLFPSQPHDALLLMMPVGGYVHQLSTGSALPLLLLYGASIACIASGVACSRDMYPEIYASARHIANVIARVRGQRFSAPVSSKQSRSGMRTGLRGPYTEIWKQLAFMRRANGTLIVAIGIALAILIGVGAGVSMRHDDALGIAILCSVMVMLVMFLAMGGTSLAADISKPLWWLGDGSTFEKLLGWTIGSAIPAAIFIGLLMFTTAIVARSLPVAIIGLTTMLALPLALRGIGVFVYSLIPSGADQRGPAMGLRLLLLYVALAPALAAAIAVGMTVSNVPEAPFLAIVVGLSIESAIALYFAAQRIEGRGVEFAFAEKQ
jgi:hypothetical protein